MWVITGSWKVKSNGKLDEVKSRYLKPGKAYTFGRNVSWLLGASHGHVSNVHATFKVEATSAEDVSDLSHKPALTVLPQEPLPDPKKEGQFKQRALVLLPSGGGEPVHLTHTVNAKQPPGYRALEHGDKLCMTTKSLEHTYLIEWRPVVFNVAGLEKQKQAEVVEKVAGLGFKVVKKDLSEGAVITHLLADTITSISKAAVLDALASRAHIVRSSFLDALVEATTPLPLPEGAKPGEEEWSSLELDAVGNWPKDETHLPQAQLTKDEAVDGSFVPDDRRKSLMEGLTVLGLGLKEGDRGLQLAQRAVELCGGSFVAFDPFVDGGTNREMLHDKLKTFKEAADKSYAAFLRQANRSIPAAARGSGFVYLFTGPKLISRMADTGVDVADLADPAVSLGLKLAEPAQLAATIYACDLNLLFKASRCEGATQSRPQSLPSQVSASIASSRGQIDPPPDVADAPASSQVSEQDVSADFTFGDDLDLMDFDLDQYNEPPSSPPAPTPASSSGLKEREPEPVARASTSTSTFDFFNPASIPAPVPRSRTRLTAAKASVASLGNGAGSTPPDPQSQDLGQSMDDSYDAPLPQSEKARSLYQSIRSKSRGVGTSQASGSLANMPEEVDDDDVEIDFVVGQRTRRRAAADEEQRKKARLEADEARRQSEVPPEASTGGGGGKSSRETPALDGGPEQEEARRAAAAAAGEMPPPPVPERSKRKVAEADDIGVDFLRAPIKRKKKNQVEDELDKDFNNLKIARLPGRQAGPQDAPREADGQIPRTTAVYVELVQRKDRPARAPVDQGDGPNYKKFISNKENKPHGPRRFGPRVALLGETPLAGYLRAKTEVTEDEEMKPLEDAKDGSFAESAATSQRKSQASATSAAGARGGRRQKLIAAGDSDDEPSAARGSLRGSKTSSSRKATLPDDDQPPAQVPVGTTPRTTATLEESDDDDVPAPRPKARAGRKKLIQADDSEDEDFKGWGAGARGKRR